MSFASISLSKSALRACSAVTPTGLACDLPVPAFDLDHLSGLELFLHFGLGQEYAGGRILNEEHASSLVYRLFANTPMTMGVLSSQKLLVVHSTNFVKLYTKAALSWYSLEACA